MTGAFPLGWNSPVRQFLTPSLVLSADVRTLRLLTVLVTLLSLPAYGLAGLAHARSCQAQMTAVAGAVVAGDCCPGKSDPGAPCKRLGDNPDKNGGCTPCKAGFSCKSPQSYEPVHLLAMDPLPMRPALISHPPTLQLSHSTGGLWRPPRLI
jgi:hypothetical protein